METRGRGRVSPSVCGLGPRHGSRTQGRGGAGALQVCASRPLPPTLIRFAAQALKGSGSDFAVSDRKWNNTIGMCLTASGGTAIATRCATLRSAARFVALVTPSRSSNRRRYTPVRPSRSHSIASTGSHAGLNQGLIRARWDPPDPRRHRPVRPTAQPPPLPRCGTTPSVPTPFRQAGTASRRHLVPRSGTSRDRAAPQATPMPLLLRYGHRGTPRHRPSAITPGGQSPAGSRQAAPRKACHRQPAKRYS
jgi:hypothetical protein